ncbi:hypothetical protein ONZ45_g13209 [Pleurotus djamor]|nr:hypothetical protein ONZ45_g13209 [Pleurotus djamor]
MASGLDPLYDTDAAGLDNPQHINVFSNRLFDDKNTPFGIYHLAQLRDVASSLALEPNAPGEKRMAPQRILALHDDDAEEPVELNVRIVGALIWKDLPPFYSSDKTADLMRKRAHLRQSVSLTGFNTPNFLAALSQIQSLSKLASRNYKEGSFDTPKPEVRLGHRVINASTRYLTSLAVDYSSQHLPFDHSTDPDGLLESLRGTDFVHSQDNIVSYLFRDLSGGPGGPIRVTEMEPVSFRIGDIVELLLSFNVGHYMSGQQWRHKLFINLRGVTLLERGENLCTLTLEAPSDSSAAAPIPRKGTLKRPILYDNEMRSSKRRDSTPKESDRDKDMHPS